jgi:hypothetical protein
MLCGHKAWWKLAVVLLLAGSGVPGQPGPDFISVAVSPGLVTFALPRSGVASGSSPLSIVTTWQIQRGGTVVSVYAYFADSTAALSDGAGSNIPSARVLGSVNGAPAAAFSGAGPFSAGGSLTVFSQQVRNNKNFTRTDTLNLQIDTTGLNLRAGSYSGVARIQSFAM